MKRLKRYGFMSAVRNSKIEILHKITYNTIYNLIYNILENKEHSLHAI